MKPIKMKFYNNVDKKLNRYIRHYWYSEGTVVKTDNMQLLPMDHYDIIVPIEGKLIYELDGKCTPINYPMVHGLRHKNIKVVQDGHAKVWGISFTPWGFHAFYQSDMSMLTDKIVKLKDCVNELNDVISKTDFTDMESMIIVIERCLLKFIEQLTDDYDNVIDYIDSNKSVLEFCNETGIQRRTFERYFKKIIGVSPKDFMRIYKFEESSRSLLFDDEANLVEVANEWDYFDQAHFTRTFKKYSSYTPKKFMKEKPSIKSKIDFE